MGTESVDSGSEFNSTFYMRINELDIYTYMHRLIFSINIRIQKKENRTYSPYRGEGMQTNCVAFHCSTVCCRPIEIPKWNIFKYHIKENNQYPYRLWVVLVLFETILSLQTVDDEHPRTTLNNIYFYTKSQKNVHKTNDYVHEEENRFPFFFFFFFCVLCDSRRFEMHMNVCNINKAQSSTYIM